MATAVVRAGRTFHGAFRSNLRNQVRYYTLTGWMISTLLSPIFLLLGASVVSFFLAGSAVPPRFAALTGYPSYVAFVVLGVATNSLAASALEDGGTAVYGEQSEGTWDLIAITPMNRFVWIGAKTLAGLVASFIDFFIVLALGLAIFHIGFHLEGLPVALLGLAMTIAGLQGFGFLMAAVGLAWREPNALAILLSPVLVLLSGMTFPVEALPAWVQVISNAFPLTHGLRILRDALLLGRGLGDLAPEFGALALSGAAFMLVGYTAFRAMDRRARRTGGLSLY